MSRWAIQRRGVMATFSRAAVEGWPAAEIRLLLSLLRRYLIAERDELLRNGIRLRAIGGLGNPRGLAYVDGRLHVLDRGRRAVLAQPVADGGECLAMAENLPVGAACPLDFAGGLSVDHRGGLLIAADGERSVLRLYPA